MPENLWIKALKVYNKNSPGEFCIPRKGSGGYQTIQTLMKAPKALSMVQVPPPTSVPKGKKKTGKKIK